MVGASTCVTLAAAVLPPLFLVLISALVWYKRKLDAATAPEEIRYSIPQVIFLGEGMNSLRPTFGISGFPSPLFQISSGKLPQGLQLDFNSGEISGTPENITQDDFVFLKSNVSDGSESWQEFSSQGITKYFFTIKASNFKGSCKFSGTLNVQMHVSPPARLLYEPQSVHFIGLPMMLKPLPDFWQGIPHPEFCLESEQVLPADIVFNNTTGELSGVPETPISSFLFSVTASNKYGYCASPECQFTIKQCEPPDFLTYPELAHACLIVGDYYHFLPLCTFGSPPATFSIHPELPCGLMIDPLSGHISGTVSSPAVSRKDFTIALSNLTGSCSFQFQLEVQIHIPPSDLQYPLFVHYPNENEIEKLQGVYQIFVCGIHMIPIIPNSGLIGSHLTFSVIPTLPSGIELHKLNGIISGKPSEPTAKSVYVITASNQKGSITTQVTFATCHRLASTEPNHWSTDQVQLWLESNSMSECRQKLQSIDGSKLLQFADPTVSDEILKEIGELASRALMYEIQKLQLPREKDKSLAIPRGLEPGSIATQNMLHSEIRDEYESHTILGNGGFGVVIHASRLFKQSRQYSVAIKVMYADGIFSKQEIKNMMHEATILGKISSPFVVGIKDFGMSIDCSQCWLIMDYIKGKSLQDLLTEGYCFNEKNVTPLSIQILSGLSAIHKLGITHCDIKPANIMKCDDSCGQSSAYKLVDLGITVAHDKCSSFATTTLNQKGFRGTPGYMCPEAILVGEAADVQIGPKSDLWSLGATIYELLTGNLPFCKHGRRPNVFEMVDMAKTLDQEPPDLCKAMKEGQPEVSQRFSAIVQRALQKRQGLRYKTADEMKRELDNLQEGDQTKVPQYWSSTETAPGEPLLVDLPADGDEFKEVQALVAGSSCGLCITRIQRMQNKAQWTLFQAKRLEMGERHNELRLFHGTAAGTVQLINRNSFNRSYCGKNATAYGQGVYFASTANYSADDTYSRPDPRGDKRMYLCRVLVGEWTLGDSCMRYPPIKGSGEAQETYDTTVDNEESPSIFVVYHDAQAYPEHLITFRRL
jgi:serine/threonine protein kinase